MRNGLINFYRPSRGRRGAIFFLVTAVLSVVVLIAATLIYISKLEAIASNNAGRSVQARMSIASGIAVAIRSLARENGETTALSQPWANGWQQIRAADSQTTKSASRLSKNDENSTSTHFLANIAVLDESSRLNVNAIEPPKDNSQVDSDPPPPTLTGQDFQNFIKQRLSTAGLQADNGASIATKLLSARLGSGISTDLDRRISLGNLTSNTLMRIILPDTNLRGKLLADLRRRSYGDDTPIRTMGILHKAADTSEDLFQAIAPYLTTFSSSPELWYDSDHKPFVRTPLNKASIVQIHDTLSQVYPDADDIALCQFAVNIADRRDTDSIPTAYPEKLGIYPIIGFELTPVVSEVCPSVSSMDDKNQGQYIEIYNPLSQSVDLGGWRVDWGGGQYVFSQSLGPGATLIITNNIDNSDNKDQSGEAPGMGSFFNVFRILPTGSKNQIVEEASMNLVNESGMINLYDKGGNLIDYLIYQGGAFNGINRGFQKRSPFSHFGAAGLATPFQPDIDKPLTDEAIAAWEILNEEMNKPFLSSAELLTIPSEYLQVTRVQPKPWTFPSITDSDGHEPDASLLNVFTVADIAMTSTSTSLNGKTQPWDSENGPRRLAGLPESTTSTLVDPMPLEIRYRFDPISFGKINLNTASSEVLRVLPALNDTLVARILAERNLTTSTLNTPNGQNGIVPFRSLSDFAMREDLWTQYTKSQQLRTLIGLAPFVCFNSNSFFLAATNTTNLQKPGKNETFATCLAQVQINERGACVLNWNFLPSVSSGSGSSSRQKTTTTPSLGTAQTIQNPKYNTSNFNNRYDREAKKRPSGN